MHGNVRVSSVFTSESGEWKLGGLDVLSSMKEDEAVIYVGTHLSYHNKSMLTLTLDLRQSHARLYKIYFTRGVKIRLGCC